MNFKVNLAMKQSLWNFDWYCIKFIENILDELAGYDIDYPGWNMICFSVFLIFLSWPSKKLKIFSLC